MKFPENTSSNVRVLYWVFLSLALCASLIFLVLALAQRNSSRMIQIINFLVSVGIMMAFLSLIVKYL